VEKRFLERLNPDTQQLVHDIEAFASLEIEVRSAPTPSLKTAASPKAVALMATEMGATLLYREEDNFQSRAALHELLHLRRYWLDLVPQLTPVDDPHGDKTRIANEIENTLEHLVIFPQEAHYGFDPYLGVNKREWERWQTYPWVDINEPWARRKTSLLSWLTVDALATDEAVKTLARRYLENEGLLEEAENFSDKIQRLENSKERCLATAIRFLRIPRHEAEMVYLDIRSKKLVRKPVPEN
jgi:hypothetical protein